VLFQKNWKCRVGSSEVQDTDDGNIEVTDEEDSESDSCSTSAPQNRNQYPELYKAIDRANASKRRSQDWTCQLGN